ncbi:uncharacterized protein LOC131671814 [Phymastichus coffea]|uniref:uncharacterized protein LOC131671814 n=1 Tax=Phymastichus coffea TaxID=108790 RepID=UPI00273BB41A|nr:uncharacterized protein LOC131671814 [Phymastichus coffea]
MTDSEPKILKVELRELQTLLRKKFSDELEVIEHHIEPLLPPGENYGSTMLKVDAVVKKNAQANREHLHLVAKMLPATEFQRKMFDSPYTFKKEAFLYQELIPSYQHLEREYDVKNSGIFDIVPELYGVRYSLKSNEDFDDDAVILMQNLKVLGYYTANRKEGLDLEHANVAILALARFHALGIAMRQHKPDQFEIIKKRSKCLDIEQDDSFEKVQQFYIKLMRKDPKISVHFERLNAAMTQETVTTWTAPPPEEWSTIVHSDFWVNNFMFRKDPNTGHVTDIKFVDFQNYLNLSPLRELTFFLMVSLDASTMENHFDNLLNFYYESFISVLKRLECNIQSFSKDKFDERMKIDAFHEFPHCPFMLRILSADVKNDLSSDQIENMMLGEQFTPLFIERLRRCVKKYAEKGWLGD